MAGKISTIEVEFRESVEQPLEEAARIGQADIVVGIPFYNEAGTIGRVIDIAGQALHKYYPDQRCVICCAGSERGSEALTAARQAMLPENVELIAFLMKGHQVSGKGWALRAIMEIADELKADLVVLEADLLSSVDQDQVTGLSPEWITRLITPVRSEKFDVVLSRFDRHWLETPIANHLIRPLIAAIYNLDLHDPLCGELAISSDFLKTYLDDAEVWASDVGRYGIDVWLLTRAIVKGANIAEVYLGAKLYKSSPGKQEVVLREQAKTIFEQVSLTRDFWKEKSEAILPVASLGFRDTQQPIALHPDIHSDVVRYRKGFNQFHPLYREVLPAGIFAEMEGLAESDPTEFDFTVGLWGQSLYEFLVTFCFHDKFAKEDIVSAVIPLYHARVASFARAMEKLDRELAELEPDRRQRLLSLEAERELEEQIEEFIRRKPAFFAQWKVREKEAKPLLPLITYREFIPGVPLVLPQEFRSPTGKAVSTDDVHKDIRERYLKEFEHFVHDRLKMPRWATSFEIAESVRSFMGRAERELGKLLAGDLYTVEGTDRVARTLFDRFPHGEMFTLKPEVTSALLRQFPPANLLVKYGKSNVAELEEEFEPNDILALSSFSEERGHVQKIRSWISDSARPEHFGQLPVKPLVVSWDDFPSLAEMKEASTLSKLGGRVVVCNLRKGVGGEFPLLRYFTMMIRNIVEAEKFGEVWEKFAQRKRDFGLKVFNSLEGHWGRELLSVHNLFENKVHRVVVQRLRQMAQDLERESEFASLSMILNTLADSYHLAITLVDGVFVACSAWTWASYSFKGGEGFPTPLSALVERDWATRELLVELYRQLGGSEDILDEKIVELVGQGREPENIVSILLPETKEVEEVSPEVVTRFEEPCSGEFHRFRGNPILGPIKEHAWESKYVFNAGAIRMEDKVYLLYRAMGDDTVSRLGLAVSADGFSFERRSEHPIFQPAEDWEKMGCEDPRLTLIDGRIYMLYTAYSSIAAQIAMASIDVDDFLHSRWERWQRHGLLFPGFSDKDAILFPEKFAGRYAIYHRIQPSIWVSFSETLSCPWPVEDHRMLAGPRAGMVWDGVKVGAGAQPLKTRYGWLLIYHGVDCADVYRLGVLVVDLNDPGKILYRSPNFILEPKERYETGEEGTSQVSDVVFTCGAVPAADKEILDDEDEIIVYYGAADTVIAAAKAKVAELIPGEALLRL